MSMTYSNFEGLDGLIQLLGLQETDEPLSKMSDEEVEACYALLYRSMLTIRQLKKERGLE